MSHPRVHSVTLFAAKHAQRRSTDPRADAVRHRTTIQRTGIVSSGSITTCTFFCITQLSVCL